MRYALRETFGVLAAAVACSRCQPTMPAAETPPPAAKLDAAAGESKGPAVISAATSAPSGGAGTPSAVDASITFVPDANSAEVSQAEHALGAFRIRLLTEGSECSLVYGNQTGEVGRLKLDVKAPCYVLLWHGSAPRNARPGRAPVGTTGDVMSFRYPDKGGDTLAMVVIGDEVPDMLRTSDRLVMARQHGYHCAGSAQGVLFRGRSGTTVPKRDQVGIFCVEVPIDEASFWLTTHPPK